MSDDPVQRLADVLTSLDQISDTKRRPNLYTLAERVRWIQMAIASTRLDMQRHKGELDVLAARVERLARKVDRDHEDDGRN